MHLKAALFLGIAILASALLLVQSPHIATFALIMLVSWSSARTYYFAFYVIEKYVDPDFKYSGLGSLLVYLSRGARGRGGSRL